MLFYGPTGAGKKTRIMALLREIFGSGVERVKLDHRTFKTPTGRAVEMTTVSSTYHIEINPGDAGIYDRFVVQDLIKEMAQYNPVSGMNYIYFIKCFCLYLSLSCLSHSFTLSLSLFCNNI
jgi:replication factor C subunit 3/5